MRLYIIIYEAILIATPIIAIHMLPANNAANAYVYLLNLVNNQIYLMSEIDAIDIDKH